MIFNFKHHHLHVNIKGSGWGTSWGHNIYTWPVRQLEVWYNGVSRDTIYYGCFLAFCNRARKFLFELVFWKSLQVSIYQKCHNIWSYMKSENCVNVSYGTPRFVIASFFSIWSLITQIASSIFVHKCFVAPVIASNICVGKVWLHKYWCFHQQENFNAFGSQLGSNENLTSPNWNLTTSIAMYRMSIFRSRLFPRNLWE